MKHFIFLIVLVCSNAITLKAQETGASTLRQRLVTVAGELKIAQLDEGTLGNKFAITLNKDIILKTNGEQESGKFSDFPIPKIIKHIKNGVPPFDELVIFQQNMWGNACDGGPIWFLGLNKNGSFGISTPIDFCGGRAPIIKEAPDKVTIIIPGGPPNRGTGYIPGETWVYENGKVRQIKAQKRTKK